MILILGLLSACEDKKDEKKEPQLRDAEVVAGQEAGAEAGEEQSDMGLEGGEQPEDQGGEEAGAEGGDSVGDQDVSGGEPVVDPACEPCEGEDCVEDDCDDNVEPEEG